MVDEEAIQDRAKYEQDLRTCQGYANRLSPGNNAVRGAVTGAIIGAAVGAVVGDSGSIARSTAGYGAVAGASGAAGGTYAMQINVIRNCMIGRGYMILDAAPGTYTGVPMSDAYSNQNSGISRRCQIAPGAEGCEAELAAAEQAEKASQPEVKSEAQTDSSRPSDRACSIAPGMAGCADSTKQETEE